MAHVIENHTPFPSASQVNVDADPIDQGKEEPKDLHD